MKLLTRVFSLGAVAVLTGYAVLAKAALTSHPLPLLVGYAISVLALLVLEAMAHLERVHQIHATTEAHQTAQEALGARVDELDRSVKSLTNVVGGGSAWK